MKWGTIRFGDLYSTESRNGLTKPSKIRGSGYKMINMGELFANDRIYDIPMELAPLKDTEKMNAKIEIGDLLFARQSLVLEGAGKCSIVMEVSPLTVFESHLIRVRLDRKRALPMFYYYYFKSPLSPMASIVSQCAQAGIRGSDLQELNVIFPPLYIQNKIAQILSYYDDLIENNQKQIKLLEEAAQRLYKEWFIDLRFPGHETTPIVDGVPEGWKEQSLYQIADVVMGQSPKSEYYNQVGEGLPFHQGVGSYGNRFVSDETYSTSFTRIAEAGSILFSVRAPVGRLNLTKNKVVIGRGLAAINHRRRAQSYLFYLLKEKFFRDDIIGNGSIFASISKEELLNQKFLIPIDSLVGQFNGIAGGIDKKIDILSEQIRLLTEARNRLLPKLMSGEIEV